MASAPADRPLAGAAVRVGATLALTAMFAIAKLLEARGVHLLEIIFWRQAMLAPAVLALALGGPGLGSLRTRRPLAHAARAAVGLTGMTLNFGTVALLPLAEAQLLWFTTPLFATMLSAAVLRERVGAQRWLAVAMGFAGVLLVVRPAGAAMPLPGVACGIAAGLLTAAVTILLRQLGRTEPALTTVFWFGVASTVPLGLAMPFVAHVHPGQVYALLIAMGVAGAAGQIALTLSLRLASVSLIAPVDYTSLLWTTLAGVLVFGTLPAPGIWAGAAVIVGSGLWILWRERVRAAPKTSSPARGGGSTRASGG